MQKQSYRMLVLFAAITVCFCAYSLIQERLMTVGFGPENERFRHSLLVILVNRIVTMAVAAAGLALTEHSVKPAAPLVSFSVPSVANVIASAAQYEALKYVSFPLQALAKCAKTVSVLCRQLPYQACNQRQAVVTRLFAMTPHNFEIFLFGWTLIFVRRVAGCGRELLLHFDCPRLLLKQRHYSGHPCKFSLVNMHMSVVSLPRSVPCAYRFL